MSSISGEAIQIWKKGMHDGEKNTYIFWNDISKVVLLLLKDEGKDANLFSKRDPVNEMKVIGFCYALMVQRGEVEDIPTGNEVAKVLE